MNARKLFLCLILGSLLSEMAIASDLSTESASYPHEQEPIGSVEAVYDGRLMPDLQVNTFRNIHRLFPSRVVKRGGQVSTLPRSETALDELHFTVDGKAYDLFDYVSLNRVAGLVVLKDGEIVFETYQLGNTQETRWMSMSVVKSMAAILVGAAIHDGHIKSLDDDVADYVPELRGSAYEGVSIRNLLQMTSGVQWNETYTDPRSDRRALLRAQIAQKPGGMMRVMSELPRQAPPGSRWNYSTGETQVVAALLVAATGEPLAEYLSSRIWAPFGMESDATWWLDSPDGIEVGGSGLSATLRDYARFGLFLMNDGIIDGERTLPEGFIRDASTPKVVAGEQVDYGYMLWPVPDSQGTVHERAYSAYGIFGQQIYVNPREKVVVATWGAQPKPEGTMVIDDEVFHAAVCLSLR